MRRLAAAAVALAVLPGAARAATVVVGAQYDAFSPSAAAVLPGETVRWQNVGGRAHTVTADDGSFASGELAAGTSFEQVFASIGTYPYHCSLHPAMTGRIDVRAVVLDPLPVAAVPAGNLVEFSGRTADPSAPVRVERSVGGAFTAVAAATPDAAGAWRVTTRVRASGEYRATSPGGASDPRRLLVSDRRVLVRGTRRGVAVEVTPPLPYGRVLLQQRLRDRFGWWPVGRARLDYVSEASFRLRRAAPARVVLVAADGWTPLATSRVIGLGGGGQ